jgi:hypothetical protein
VNIAQGIGTMSGLAAWATVGVVVTMTANRPATTQIRPGERLPRSAIPLHSGFIFEKSVDSVLLNRQDGTAADVTVGHGSGPQLIGVRPSSCHV